MGNLVSYETSHEHHQRRGEKKRGEEREREERKGEKEQCSLLSTFLPIPPRSDLT